VIAAFALPPLAGADNDLGTLLKLLVFLAVVVVSVINSAIKKSKAAAASRSRRAEAPPVDASVRSEVLDRVRPRDEPSSARSAPPGPGRAPPSRPAARPSTARREPAAAEAPARRKGLVADAHVDVGTKLPTADDMPGAHSAHDHVHLTEIGADRGTAPKHPGAKPTAAAKVHRREGRSGYDLLRARDLDGRDRVRAGILWAEVFGPPRSRARR
jgi:hypothetical protein